MIVIYAITIITAQTSACIVSACIIFTTYARRTFMLHACSIFIIHDVTSIVYVYDHYNTCASSKIVIIQARTTIKYNTCIYYNYAATLICNYNTCMNVLLVYMHDVTFIIHVRSS